MIPEGPAFHKPKSIVAAKNLFFAAIFMGCLTVGVRDSALGISNNGGIPGIALTILGFLIMILLIKAMIQCKKWARTALLVLCLLLIIPIALHPKLITGILEAVLLGIQLLLEVVAFFFLFNKDSTVWFNKEK
jgi:hypothetical protein